jgi:hypothetical protein
MEERSSPGWGQSNAPAIGPGIVLKDRYRVEHVLGRGGMAAVWLAIDTVLERPVAVKVLSDTIAADPEFVARFRREARVVAGLWHPNLIGVYDFAEGAERPYLVLEYVPGGSLAERIAAGSPIDCERLAGELLGAVAHIHEAGIVHRDIKPQNVLIAADGSAKLIDFGIALPPDATAITRTGHLIGTARYLAPEVMGGRPATERSDLYSCGVLLRECLGNGGEGALRRTVERLCAEDPSARPRSAEEALAATERAPYADQPTERFIPVEGDSGAWRGAPPADFGPHRQPSRQTWGRLAAAVGILAAVAALALLIANGSGGGSGAKSAGANRGARETAQARQAASGTQAEGEGAGESASEGEGAAETEGDAASVPVPAGSDPALGSTLNQQGYELIQAGSYAEAVPILEQAVEAFPPGTEELDYAYALYNLGDALRLSGRPQDAVPVLERRLEIPNQTDVVSEELEAARSEAGL